MPIKWNERADSELFMHVLKIHNIKLDYQALADAMGSGCTSNAISHRISRLKSMAAGDEGTTSSAGSTPIKPQATPKSRKRTKDEADAGEEDEVGRDISVSKVVDGKDAIKVKKPKRETVVVEIVKRGASHTAE
ncbi:MAG: hypothetical protein M1826_006294 [Phylliscum demangeonii]|nr:MAG: hypothetical protein M1826_006294 [Phylliscum demangeonii]